MAHLHKSHAALLSASRRPSGLARQLLRPRNAVLQASLAERPTPGALRSRRKFLSLFPGGFRDADYLALERSPKWHAHERWQAALGHERFTRLLKDEAFTEIAGRAMDIAAFANLIFSFEIVALRDGVKTPAGARLFAQGLHELLYGMGSLPGRFDAWAAALAHLPRRLTRVLTWPAATLFGFLAEPSQHLLIRPGMMRLAARRYGWDYRHNPHPNGEAYAHALALAAQVQQDLRDLNPRDMIDVQAFLGIQCAEDS